MALPWLFLLRGAAELDSLSADGEIPVLQLLRDCIETVAVVEVDKGALLVFQFIECRGFLKLAAQVCEFVITPYLLKS